MTGDIALAARNEVQSAAFGEGSDAERFQARSRSRQKRLLASSCPISPSLPVSVCLNHLRSHWTDFR